MNIVPVLLMLLVICPAAAAPTDCAPATETTRLMTFERVRAEFHIGMHIDEARRRLKRLGAVVLQVQGAECDVLVAYFGDRVGVPLRVELHFNNMSQLKKILDAPVP